jgi:hypothetical protein
MPGLMATRKKYAGKKTIKGSTHNRITSHDCANRCVNRNFS